MEGISELLEDFDIRIARILVSGADAIIDNVKKIIIMSDDNITVDYGKGQISVYGKNMVVESLFDGRICIKGEFAGIEFHDRISVEKGHE